MTKEVREEAPLSLSFLKHERSECYQESITRPFNIRRRERWG